MIITIGGKHGAGRSTVGKLLAQKLAYKHYSTGDFLREMAKERKKSVLEMVELAAHDPAINEEIDRRTVNLGEQEDRFLMDSTLAYYFLPQSIKIFLDVDMNEAAQRIFNHKREHENYPTVKEVKRALEKRMELEKEQFLRTYHTDPYDISQYDLVIDTTGTKIEDVVNKVHAFILRHQH